MSFLSIDTKEVPVSYFPNGSVFFLGFLIVIFNVRNNFVKTNIFVLKIIHYGKARRFWMQDS